MGSRSVAPKPISDRAAKSIDSVATLTASAATPSASLAALSPAHWAVPSRPSSSSGTSAEMLLSPDPPDCTAAAPPPDAVSSSPHAATISDPATAAAMSR